MAERAFTKELLDSLMTAPVPQSVQTQMMGSYAKFVFVVTDTARAEQWNWRRTKRELRRIGLVRKGVRREYHKRLVLDG